MQFLLASSSMLLLSSAHAATLSGKVLDAAGEAVTGATVYVAQETGTRTGESGADGAYRVTEVQTGPAQVVAFKEGHALGGATRFVVGDGSEDLVLGEAGTVTLKIAAPPSQAPVAGARIHAVVLNGDFVVPVGRLAAAGFPQWRSGDDGQLVMPHMPANGYVKVHLQHLDYADTYLDFVPVRERPTPVLLEIGVPARGRVVAGERPLAGAQITVFQLGSGGQREFASATTDPDGLYAVRLSPGDYYVAARHPDWASPAPAGVSIAHGQEADLPELGLLTPYYLRGNVVLPEDKPCPGARVTYREKDTIFDETYTASDGTFVIKAASPKGTLRIVPPEGYRTEILADIKVDLGESREAVLDTIRLKRLPAITGTVTLEDGTPGAQVIVASLNLPQGLWMLTDSAGRFAFQLTVDPDVRKVVLLAEHAERFQRAEFTFDLDATEPVTVKLAAYSPDEVQPDVPGGTNNLSGILDTKGPDFACSKWFNAEHFSRDALKGKVGVMLFWAGFDTTIEGVNKVEQTRALMALYKDDPQVGFAAIHDSTSEAAEVEDFVQIAGLTCPVGLDAEPLVTFGAYRVNFIPEVVLLDKSGNVRYFQPGPRIVEFIKVLRRRAD